MPTASPTAPAFALLLRRFKAAVVLAALYTIGFGASLLLFLLLVDDSRLYVDSFRSTASSFGILFALAFLILAFARRLGFVALWVLLSGLWIVLLAGSSGYEFPLRFVQWSVFAVPLYLIGLAAAGGALRRRLGALSPMFLCGAVWIALAIAGFLLQGYASPPQHATITEHQLSGFTWLTFFGWSLWAPAPFVVAAVSVSTFWTGSRGGELAPAAGGLTRA